MGRDLPFDLPVDLPRDVPVDSVAFLGRLPIAGSSLTAFNGNTGGFSADSGSIGVDTSDPIDGSGSLASDGGAATATNLDAGPQQGDIYCGSVRTPPNGGQSELWYGVQDSSNLYFVGVDSVNDEVTLGFYSGGTKTVNATASATIAAGTVYDIELTWRTDGYQEAYVTERTGTQILGTVTDGFEDGDTSGWTLSDSTNGTFTADTTNPYEGSYRGLMEVSELSLFATLSVDTGQYTTVKVAVNPGTHHSNTAYPFHRCLAPDSNRPFSVSFNENGEILLDNGNYNTGATHALDTWHLYEYTLDWDAQTYDMSVAGGSVYSHSGRSFYQSATEIAEFEIGCQQYQSPFRIDAVELS